MPGWLLVAVLAEIVRWLAGPPVSLADAAWRESVRRETVGPSVASYTNANLPDGAESAVAPPRSSAEEPSKSLAPDTAPRDAPDEATWRRRVTDLNDAMAQNRRLIEETEARLAGLDREAVARDDPAQQAQLRAQAEEARAALDELRRKLEAARAALAALLEDARRQGVPPGWLR